jgi:ribose 5-phosphate isomerase B
MKKVILANDHGAINLREEVLKILADFHYEVTDLGVSEGSADYPDIAKKACDEYSKGNYDFGILMCGTGIGISIAANKIKGIRCALIHDSYTARMAKEHNNANFIALGGRIHYTESLKTIISNYVTAGFAGERHQHRVEKIEELESLCK